MLVESDKKLRRFIASVFRGRFSKRYSTLDDPMEVPAHVAAYQLAMRKYIQPGDRVLDVGFGLGYRLRIMAEKAGELTGIDTDRRAVCRGRRLTSEVPEICEVRCYDGCTIPYDTSTFDVVTCIDVIEHVPVYMGLIMEMIRVSKRVVLLSTPNRCPEYTRPDGKPKNRWHLCEWSYEEFGLILQKLPGVRVDWSFLNGPWDGPFECSSVVSEDTLALTAALMLLSSQGRQDDDLWRG